MTFMLFLKVNGEECPRTNTPDSPELDFPSTLNMRNNETNRQIVYSESEQLISKEGHSAILLPSKNLIERSQENYISN